MSKSREAEVTPCAEGSASTKLLPEGCGTINRPTSYPRAVQYTRVDPSQTYQSADLGPDGAGSSRLTAAHCSVCWQLNLAAACHAVPHPCSLRITSSALASLSCSEEPCTVAGAASACAGPASWSRILPLRVCSRASRWAASSCCACSRAAAKSCGPGLLAGNVSAETG